MILKMCLVIIVPTLDVKIKKRTKLIRNEIYDEKLCPLIYHEWKNSMNLNS